MMKSNTEAVSNLVTWDKNTRQINHPLKKIDLSFKPIAYEKNPSTFLLVDIFFFSLF